MSKLCKICSNKNGNPLNPTCSPYCQRQYQEKTGKGIKRTPVKKIGARTKARIQQNGTESALFARVWKNRPHICQVCNKSITEAKNYCFPHLLAKKNYPAYRYMENNIWIVCSIEHHQELDKLIATKSIIEVENAIADGKWYDFIKNNLLSVKK